MVFFDQRWSSILFTMASLSSTATSLRDLTLPFGPPKSAAETFLDLAEAADAHGVDVPDVYGQSRPGAAPWLEDFEQRVASMYGKEAAVWVPSGTMAQQITLCCAQKIRLGADRTPALPRVRRPFFAHPTSHLLLWEQEAHARLLDIPCIPVGERGRPMQGGDLQDALNAAMDLGNRPAALILEVPHREIGGEATPWEEVRELRRLCDEQGVHMHMDGARLLEILPWYEATHGVGAKEVAALFDSVYVSFYKGLGGMTGAMLLGEAAFVEEARVWLRRFGGNLYTALPYAVSALDALDRHGDSFEPRWRTMQAFVEAVKDAAAAAAAKAAAMTEGGGGGEGGEEEEEDGGGGGGEGDELLPKAIDVLVRFTPPTPQCCQVHCHIKGSAKAVEAARDRTADVHGVKVFRALRGPSLEFGPDWQYFEWSVGPVNTAEFAPTEVRTVWEHFLGCVNDETVFEQAMSDPQRFFTPRGFD
jgi:threonine aldolase